MAFRVGQKVVCVDDKPRPGANPRMDGLSKGQVYTVQRIGIDNFWAEPVLWLVEIRRELQPGFQRFGEVGYDPRRFRPVVEKKTDISIFEAMLKRAPVKHEERV
jgi:hypothetical protein